MMLTQPFLKIFRSLMKEEKPVVIGAGHMML